MNWKRTRKLFNDIHLWMGLTAGIILFLICLTGTIYTFHSEIDHWVNRDKFEVEPTEVSLPVEQLADQLETKVEGKVMSVRIFPAPESAYQFYVRKEGERRGTTYLVNQYTGEFIGDTKSRTSEFFMTIFRLHRWLLLDTKVGRPIVGWTTMIFVFIILTGLIIWVPQKVKSWKQGLRIKWSGNWKRINHDLHNALGFYAALFLLVMALTGLQWSFQWYRTGLRTLLGVNSPQTTEKAKDAPNEQVGAAGLLSINELLQIVDRELPHEGPYRIEIPSDEKPTVRVNKYHMGFFASPASDVAMVNAATGQVESLDVFSEKPLNQKIARSIKALHVGDVFGTFSKIIYFISCLIATSLPVTGTIIWLNKLKNKRKSKVNKERQPDLVAQ